MNKYLVKLCKKLIFKNKYFMSKKLPINNSRDSVVDLTLSGEEILKEFVQDKSQLFNDYNRKTKVLIKVNLNSALPYPASSSSDIIEALITILQNIDVKRICISDCSGMNHLPTMNVIKNKKINSLKSRNIKIKSFDFGRWVKIPINGEYFNSLILTQQIYKFDKIINLSNLKSHDTAGFSAAVKNLVGFMHPLQRWDLHKNNLVEKIAELPLALIPDLNIIDARKIFIDGGPDTGMVVSTNSIIINSNIIDADIKAYELLVKKKAENNIYNLPSNYLDYSFFKHYFKVMGDNK